MPCRLPARNEAAVLNVFRAAVAVDASGAHHPEWGSHLSPAFIKRFLLGAWNIGSNAASARAGIDWLATLTPFFLLQDAGSASSAVTPKPDDFIVDAEMLERCIPYI
eukprot:5419384-Pleurochrysis_carterae.AAC.1